MSPRELRLRERIDTLADQRHRLEVALRQSRCANRRNYARFVQQKARAELWRHRATNRATRAAA